MSAYASKSQRLVLARGSAAYREKAVELFMAEYSHDSYFTGQTPEMEELREGEYLYRAKVLVLRKISRNRS